ncbi:MAG TPA: galactokinase family protein [Pyrinomonadaceae bacterium]|nr:galactokinase family protein [Pyrinomonadaceae bacterium]
MFPIISDKTEELPDVAEFVEKLNAFQQSAEFFDAEKEIFISRAPGRLDLMGGIADYSGSLVLQYPIREATLCALQKDSVPKVSIISLLSEAENFRSFEIPLERLQSGDLSDYKAAREFFLHNAENHWAAYIAGVFAILAGELKLKFTEGARIFISSNVPEGKGVSSSAALEVAVMQAVNSAFSLNLNPRELALLCQKTENEIVGAPCGVMDQIASSCGEAGKLLALLCQPAELKGTILLPDEIEIWGIDSGIRHSVAGADYGSVRAGAFIGYRIIAEIAGLKVENLENNLVEITDAKWRGFLANITTQEFEKEFRAKLPEKITGREFLQKYHGTTDKITTIKPEKEYAVTAPTAHPIYENHRVQKFAEILSEKPGESNLKDLGELMFASHASYSACGLGSGGTDLLVELVKRSEKDLYGAKITGGGSGGTVAVLGRRGAGASVKSIAEKYAQETGRTPQIFSGSSPGAGKFGFRVG